MANTGSFHHVTQAVRIEMICRRFKHFFQLHRRFVLLGYQPENNGGGGGHPACRRAVASSPAEETSHRTKPPGTFVSHGKLVRFLRAAGWRPLRQAGCPTLHAWRTIAVNRIYLDKFDRITAYWVGLSLKLAQAALPYAQTT